MEYYRFAVQEPIFVRNSARWQKNEEYGNWQKWEEGDFPEQVDPRDLEFEFVAVYASLVSLMTSVKAWMTRKVTGNVQISADNMYNPIRGVPNVYWFNTGIFDAKNIHFPTVNALQLGRAHPRNEVQCSPQPGLSYVVHLSCCVNAFLCLR